MAGGCVPHYELQVSTKAYEIEGHALAVKLLGLANDGKCDTDVKVVNEQAH